MGYQSMFAISAAGMEAERVRMEVSAANLAHAHSAVEPGTEGFAPLRVVLRPAEYATIAGRVEPFASRVMGAMAGPQVHIEHASVAHRQVLEPGHPYADGQGLVTYPAVDFTSETLVTITAMRAYEANVSALNATKALAMKALEIGA